MKKFSIILFCALLFSFIHAQAQLAAPKEWELIKHIGETSLYIPADKIAEHHLMQPEWRTFPILINDSDIAPNSIIMTVTIDCANNSMRTDRFELYDSIDGQGTLIQSAAGKTSDFLPMNEELLPASKAYAAFCMP